MLLAAFAAFAALSAFPLFSAFLALAGGLGVLVFFAGWLRRTPGLSALSGLRARRTTRLLDVSKVSQRI